MVFAGQITNPPDTIENPRKALFGVSYAYCVTRNELSTLLAENFVKPFLIFNILSLLERYEMCYKVIVSACTPLHLSRYSGGVEI